MRIRSLAAAALLVAITIAATLVVRDAFSDEPEPANVTRVTLASTTLQEDRDYFVFLPESYGSGRSRRYPVLYVLDGQSQGEHTAESAALMARIGVIPEVIVVAVSSMSGELRSRDYTPPDTFVGDDGSGSAGSADRFLTFLEREMIPTIERDFRTERPRMLSGWSRGGLFVVYSLLANPALFDARFAHSPALWRDDDRIVKKLDAELAKSSAAGFLFLSLGSNENEKMTAAFGKATDTLGRRVPPSLRWRSMLTRGGVHETNPKLATPVGLCDFLCTSRGALEPQ
jgi:predicted alpha/beta superfamily hydrolase